jgi:DNA-binding response OmpR family regulator
MHISTMTDAKKRILVVEDDPAVRRLLEVALRLHYEVELAQNGAVALARVARPPPIDLIICDVMMPELNGFDFARRLRLIPEARGVPFVFLTAKNEPAGVIEGIRLGARQYITKPFKVDELIGKVQKLLRG